MVLSIVPTLSAVHTNAGHSGNWYLKSWVVETPGQEESLEQTSREEENNQLSGDQSIDPFDVADGGEWRFIQLGNIDKNHCVNVSLHISA
jgi:hypothetical protein